MEAADQVVEACSNEFPALVPLLLVSPCSSPIFREAALPLGFPHVASVRHVPFLRASVHIARQTKPELEDWLWSAAGDPSETLRSRPGQALPSNSQRTH